MHLPSLRNTNRGLGAVLAPVLVLLTTLTAAATFAIAR
jgi:hypothetical protein